MSDDDIYYREKKEKGILLKIGLLGKALFEQNENVKEMKGCLKAYHKGILFSLCLYGVTIVPGS